MMNDTKTFSIFASNKAEFSACCKVMGLTGFDSGQKW